MKTIIILTFSLFYLNAISQTSADDIYMTAYSFSKKGEYEKAVEILNKAKITYNSNEKIYFLSGECYYNNLQYKEAAENFIKSYKLKNNYALYKIAECYSQINEPYKSIEYLKLYLETKDKLLKSEIRTNKAFTNIENSKAWINLWKDKHYNNYEKKLDEARYLISKEDNTNAFDILDKLLIKNKKRYKALEMRADLLYKNGEYKSAAKDYEAASNIKNKNQAYKIKAADAWFKAEKYKKTIVFYNEVIEKNSSEIEILKKKATTELFLSDYLNAKITISKYLKYFPDDSEALNISGKIYYSEKDYINALIQYNLCLKNSQSKSEYFINRGDAYTATKMFENAVHDYSMALDLLPKQAEIYYKRGIANLNINKNESCNDFKQALKMNYHKANDYLIKYCNE